MEGNNRNMVIVTERERKSVKEREWKEGKINTRDTRHNIINIYTLSKSLTRCRGLRVTTIERVWRRRVKTVL